MRRTAFPLALCIIGLVALAGLNATAQDAELTADQIVDLALETDTVGFNSGEAVITLIIQDESGATAIEYGLIAGLVAVAIIAAVSALGTSLSDLFTSVATTVSTATGS